MFIEMNLGDTAEPKPVSSGRYALTIADAKYREAKKDIQVSIGIDGHLDAPNISHYISLPKPEDDAGKAGFKRLMLKRFLEQFGIPYDDIKGFAVEDFSGAKAASVQVNLSEPDAETGAVYNRVNLDKLVNEPERQVTTVSKKR